MDDTLERRIEALERAVTDDEHDLSALATEGETAERLDALDSRLESIEDRVAELEAATQAVRGYVGNVRSVNRDIEQRADAALARVESLEAAVTDESGSSATATSPTSSADHREEADAGGATASTPGGTASNEGSNTGERARGAGGTTGAGATGSGSGLDTGTDPASDGTGGGHHCEACGRPTPSLRRSLTRSVPRAPNGAPPSRQPPAGSPDRLSWPTSLLSVSESRPQSAPAVGHPLSPPETGPVSIRGPRPSRARRRPVSRCRG